MKFALDKAHRDFFDAQGYLELEGMIPAQQLPKFREEMTEALSKRSGESSMALRGREADFLFTHGRDLWRDHPSLRPLALRPAFAELASEIFLDRSLRLLLTQVIGGRKEGAFAQKAQQPIPFFGAPLSLERWAPVQGLVGGLLLCLEAPAVRPEEGEVAFALSPGSGVFLSKEKVIDGREVFQWTGGRYLLILFAAEKSIYVHNELDPLCHTLKSQGYVFGDRLKSDRNPRLLG